MLRDRDADLQKPFIDGDSVIDGDGSSADTGQFMRQLGGIRGILQSIHAMLGSGIERNTLARPRRDETIPTELPGDIRLYDLLSIGPAIDPGFGQVGQLLRGDRASSENVVRHATSTTNAHGTTGLIGGHL